MSNFLDEIRALTLLRLDAMEIEQKILRKPNNFVELFKSETTNLIAEIKFATPRNSKLANHDPIQLAQCFLDHAVALSILTEPFYFKGSIDYIYDIRTSFPHAHILMKDFIMHEMQLLQALYYGADAVLLIVKMLTDNELIDLYNKCLQLNLTPLLEVSTMTELCKAEELGAVLIGVNNRDLNTLDINCEVAKNLISQRKSAAHFIALSGIDSAKYVNELRVLGYCGFLIGTHLMTAPNPRLALQRLLGVQ